MSFLGIAFLLASPLIALPIILHFWDRRRNVEIQWGAMQFLRNAQSQQSKARKLKEWLQLLCRVAALAALIFALARPLIPGAWLGAKMRTETIVLIDNSMSTSRTVGDQTRLDQLIGIAKSTIQSQSHDNSVRVLTVSPKPTWVTPAPVSVDSVSINHVYEQIDQINATQDPGEIITGLLAAVQAERDPLFQLREIVVITDSQRSTWPVEDAPIWDRLQKQIAESDIQVDVRVVGWAEVESESNNVAVTEVAPSRPVVGIDRLVSFSATIQNFGDRPTESTKVDWYQDGKLIESLDVPAIQPMAKQSVTWDHSFDSGGAHTVECKLQVDDAVDNDNRAATVVQTVLRVPVLMVDGGDGFSETDQDSYFPSAALGRVAGSDQSSWQSVFDPRNVSPQQLATMDLSEYRAIVIPNMQSMSDLAIEQTSDFVRQGGGLWVGLGPRTDITWFNDRFFADGDGLSPIRLDDVVEDDAEAPATLINPYLGTHPATRQLIDQERLDIGDVRVKSRLRFDQQTVRPDLAVLLGLTNGQPLAVERTFGRGRVIVQAIPLRLQWSELVQSQAFVVMVQDWLAYITEPSASQHNLSPGQPIALRLRDATHLSATLKKPSGEPIDLTGQQDGDEVSFHTTRTSASGLYELELGLSGRKIPFVVQRDSAESNLAAISTQEKAKIAERFEYQRDLNPDGQVPTATLPIWPILLMGLVGLIVAELLLSGLITRQRFSVDTVGSTTSETGIESTPVPTGFGSPATQRDSEKASGASKQAKESVLS